MSSFDTGNELTQRRRLREAVAALLEPLLLKQGGYLRQVVQLPKPFRAGSQDDEDMFRNAIQGNAPAMFVALGRKDFAQRGSGRGTSSNAAIDVFVYVLSTHQGGLMNRVGGVSSAPRRDTSDPGVEFMLENAEELLTGRRPIEDATELLPSFEDELYTAEDRVVWEIGYKCQLTRVINDKRSLTTKLVEIESTNFAEGLTPVTTLSRLSE